jgi:hypothetical protein
MGGREDLAAPARDQEDVRAPALVRGRLLSLAEMGPAVPAMNPRRQHEPVHPHEPPNALAVVARQARMRLEYRLDGFATSQLLKDEIHGDAGSHNDRLTHHHFGIGDDHRFTHRHPPS